LRSRFARTVSGLTAVLLFAWIVPAGAQKTDGKIDGFVVDQSTSLPVSGAAVALYLGDRQVGTTRSKPSGEFELEDLAPAVYTVTVSATGYQTTQSARFSVAAGQEANVSIAIARASDSQSSALKTIGSVTANSQSAIASTTTITKSLDPTLVQKENYTTFGAALARQPGVDATGLSSSVNDDTYLDIRGLGASETQALLDGHPVGPQGVYGINGGGSYPTSFDYSDSPIFGLSRIQVTFGSGATGLYGVDAIGGTVDMLTLAPTLRPQTNVSQSLGDQGRMQTAFNTTGTAGRLSYALAGGVLGTYGMFSPQAIAQTARPNNNSNANNNGACTASNDISACNLALNTYSVSQNATLRSGLAKLVYNLSKNTTLSSTLYSSGQRGDSTGNGDNDYMPYDTRLAVIDTSPGNCRLPGDAGGRMTGFQVITVANPQNNPTACYSAQQWAKASFGPFGGGEDRNRGTNMSDYDFKLQSLSGKNNLTAGFYYNYYKYYKSSEVASGLDPSGTEFAGTAFSQFLNTQGYLVADDIQNEHSDVGFGAFREDQLGTRLDYNFVGQGLFSYETPEESHYTSGFARAAFDLNDKLSLYSNFWVKNDSAYGDTNFDPRVSLVLRPETSDVFRVTFGHSTGDPAAELKASGPPIITANPSSLNPSCTPYNEVGNGGNPNIRPESGNDYEVGYAHRFEGDSSVQINAYYTSVADQLFSADLPLAAFGNVPIAPTLLKGFADKIGSVCPGVNPTNPSSVIPFLSIATTYNAASAISKGIELSGRQRITRHWYLDYGYDLQSVVQNGVNDNILQNNPFVINGGQVLGIPINQGNLGVDYANAGTEVRLDGYIVGNNNPSSRPAYNVWNGFVTKALAHGYTVTVGIQNVFNEAAQDYGYIGHSPLIPENHFFNDSTPIQQYLSTGSNEEFGLPTRSFLLTISSRV
jgi:outer membrane receptor protein involved in Fe transport